MKYISLLLTIFSLATFQHGFGEELLETPLEETSFSAENTMLEIEKELLSLEDDLLNAETALLLPEEIISAPSLLEEALPTPVELLQTSFTKEQEPEPETTFFTTEESPVQLASPPIKEEITKDLMTNPLEINLSQVFAGSPWIYFTLFSLSFFAVSLSLYSIVRIKQQSSSIQWISKEVRGRLLANDFPSATQVCQNKSTLFSRMVQSGLSCRRHGLQAILENMKAEGKRESISFWQQLGLLQDIAIIAPMLGLLGTVIGLFYAFYDLNRSFESLNNLLDGLGISVGTTIAGIGVAILAMILHSTAKFRLVRALAKVETEATSLAHLMDEKH